MVQEIVAIPQRFLIAERLHRLGPTVIEPLQSLLVKSDNSEVKILSSLVLLQLGSRAGLEELLKAVVVDRTYALLIARHLATNKVYESVDRITNRLRSTDNSQIDLIVGLLTALVELRGEVPEDLMSRFQQPSTPWQVRTLIDQISEVRY